LISNFLAKVLSVRGPSDISEPSYKEVVLVALQVELENHKYHVGPLLNFLSYSVFFRLSHLGRLENFQVKLNLTLLVIFLKFLKFLAKRVFTR